MNEIISFLLTPFNVTAFTMFGAPTSWGEVGAFVTGAICVLLVAKQNIWNWPIGILNAGFFLLLFLTSGLFADSALQVVYIILGFYGWWAWLHGGPRRAELPVSRTSLRQWAALIIMGILGTLIMTWILVSYTPSTVPVFDAVTTVLSLLATWGQTRKKVESWWLWILADVIYIPLYQYKGLTLTAILYGVFMTLCIVGLVNWTRDLRSNATTTPELPVVVPAR